MSEAIVTLKLTPKEFDLIRRAIGSAIIEAAEIIERPDTPPKTRHDRQTDILQLRDLEKELK